MTTELDYALMAGAAYRSTRDPINRFPTPTVTDWSEIAGAHRNLQDSGFEAVAFKRGIYAWRVAA